MKEKTFEVLSPVCYGIDPCLFKIPHQEYQAGKVINYFSCKSSEGCLYRKATIDNLNLEESDLEKNVKSE